MREVLCVHMLDTHTGSIFAAEVFYRGCLQRFTCNLRMEIRIEGLQLTRGRDTGGAIIGHPVAMGQTRQGCCHPAFF